MVRTGPQLVASPPNKIDEVEKKLSKETREWMFFLLFCAVTIGCTIVILLLNGVHQNFVLVVTSGQIPICVSNKILVLLECRRYTVEILRSCFKSDYNLSGV